jgi:hypothetical protein
LPERDRPYKKLATPAGFKFAKDDGGAVRERQISAEFSLVASTLWIARCAVGLWPAIV